MSFSILQKRDKSYSAEISEILSYFLSTMGLKKIFRKNSFTIR